MERKIFFRGFLLFALAVGAQAEDKVVLAEDFKDREAFSIRWHIVSSPGKSTFEPDGKGLVLNLKHNPFNDSYIECSIPLVKKGMLEFDMEFPDPADSGGIGLYVDIYNIGTFFHSACRDWRYYFPEPESKRVAGFDIEPVGHHKIAPVAPKGRSHYRIVFDADRDRVEFFKDDMEDPAAIVGNVSVFGHDFYRGGKIRIGSMGFAGGKPRAWRLLDLKLTALAEKRETDLRRSGVLIFQGMTFDELKIFEALTANGVERKVCSLYTMESTSHAMIISNRLLYDRMPGEKKLRNSELIVLADAPAGPGGIIPDFVLKDMADFVRGGGRLVIFGGFFTLEKGEFQKTPLAEVLPVELESPFATGKFASPAALKSVSPEYAWIDAEKSFDVVYYHDLKLKKDAVVKLTAGGKPMLVERRAGRGSVAVFLGKKAGYGKLFTDHFLWFKLAAQICRGK